MKLKKVYAWKILYLILALLDISYYFIKLFLNTEYEKMLIALIAIISFLLMIPKLWIWKTYKKIAIYTIFFLLTPTGPHLLIVPSITVVVYKVLWLFLPKLSHMVALILNF